MSDSYLAAQQVTRRDSGISTSAAPPLPPAASAATKAAAAASEDVKALSDEELVSRVVAGKLAPHSLEKELDDCERAVRVRRAWCELTNPVTAEHAGMLRVAVEGSWGDPASEFAPSELATGGQLGSLLLSNWAAERVDELLSTLECWLPLVREGAFLASAAAPDPHNSSSLNSRS